MNRGARKRRSHWLTAGCLVLALLLYAAGLALPAGLLLLLGLIAEGLFWVRLLGRR